MVRLAGANETWRRLSGRVGDRLARPATGPIGLDVGTDALRAVQLAAHDGHPRIRAAASTSLPSDAEAGSASWCSCVRDLLRGSAFRGRRVVSVVPPAALKLMVLNYELAPGEEDDGRVLRLVEERVDEPIDRYVVDYQLIRMASDREAARAALVAVARHDAVVEYLEAFRAAGLDVVALEIKPVAVHRLVGRVLREDLTSHSLVLYVGRRTTELIGLAGRRLVLYREVAVGEDSLIESVAKTLELPEADVRALLREYGVWPDAPGKAFDDPAEAHEIAATVREILKPAGHALAEEVARAGVYTASQWRGAAIERVQVFGRVARWRGIAQWIEQAIGIPTEVPDPLLRLASDDFAGSEEDLAVATGLALRGVAGEG